MNSSPSSRIQSRNSRLISLNRSPCDCHEGDERYVVSSGRFRPDTRAGLGADYSPLPRREIPRTPTKMAQSSRYNLVKSRSSRSLSRSRASNYHEQDNRRNYYDDEDFQAYADDNNNDDFYAGAHYDADLEAAETKLHVLAIKPKVAPRPRDNILFEGDMDLRTTFETTYEALARTRLENFREYKLSLLQKQEAQLKSAHPINGGEINPQLEQSGNAQPKLVSKDREVSVAQKSPLKTNEDVEDIEAQEEVEEVEGKEEIKLMSRLDADGDNLGDPLQMTTNLQRQHTFTNNDDADYKFNDDVATKQNTSYIDPDLSPLIVYDSNMNRLVTVGLRKRSKYRPSTSLRSGANGFFGDQNTPNDSNPSDSHVANEQLRQSTNRKSQSTAHKKETVHELQNSRNSNNSNQVYQQKQQHPALGQDDGLAQTKRMLNVNSKRKIRDNINLQDHIRGDNLISHSPSPTWDYQQRQQQQLQHQSLLTGHDELGRDDSEELALNEEVRRISAREPNSRDNGHDMQYSGFSANESSGHKSAARSHNNNSCNSIMSRNITPANERSKMERICQNQSIDIFAAKYLEEEL